MPHEYIVKDANDPTIYVEHRTNEISPLPPTRAANKYTGFQVFSKEIDMALSDEKRQQGAAALETSVDALRKVEQSNADQAGKAADEGRDSKEKGEGDGQEPTPAPQDKSGEPAYVTQKDFQEFAAELTRGITDALKVVTESVLEVRADLKEIRDEKDAAEKSMTPAAAIYANIMGSLGGQQTKTVDDLKGQGPDETEVPVTPPNGPGGVQLGVPFLQKMHQMNRNQVAQAMGGQS
jgi:hypothetical protein